jgi:hypothetical protein
MSYRFPIFRVNFTPAFVNQLLSAPASSTPIWDSSRHFAFMVELFFSSIMEIPFGVHQQFDRTVSHNAGANGSLVVPATSSDIVLCNNEKFCHGFCTQVSRHNEMPDLVSS